VEKQIEFFKSYNDAQHLRREKIYEQFFYFSSLLTLQIGFIGFYLLNFPVLKINNIILFYSFILCLLIVFGFIIKIIFIAILWINNKDYAEFAKPNDIKIYIDKLNEYTKTHPDNNEWDKYVLNEYIKISNYNITINEKRHYLNMKFRKYLGFTLLSLLISFIPYFFLMGNELNSQKIIVLNDSVSINDEKIKISIVDDKLVIDGNVSSNILLFNFIEEYLKVKTLDILNQNSSTIESIKKDEKMADDKKAGTPPPTKQEVAPPPPPTRYIQDSVEPPIDKYQEK